MSVHLYNIISGNKIIDVKSVPRKNILNNLNSSKINKASNILTIVAIQFSITGHYSAKNTFKNHIKNYFQQFHRIRKFLHDTNFIRNDYCFITLCFRGGNLSK